MPPRTLAADTALAAAGAAAAALRDAKAAAAAAARGSGAPRRATCACRSSTHRPRPRSAFAAAAAAAAARHTTIGATPRPMSTTTDGASAAAAARETSTDMKTATAMTAFGAVMSRIGSAARRCPTVPAAASWNGAVTAMAALPRAARGAARAAHTAAGAAPRWWALRGVRQSCASSTTRGGRHSSHSGLNWSSAAASRKQRQHAPRCLMADGVPLLPQRRGHPTRPQCSTCKLPPQQHSSPPLQLQCTTCASPLPYPCSDRPWATGT